MRAGAQKDAITRVMHVDISMAGSDSRLVYIEQSTSMTDYENTIYDFCSLFMQTITVIDT